MNVQQISKILEEEDVDFYDDEIYDDGSEVDDEVVDPNFCTEIYSDSNSEISETDNEEEIDTAFIAEEDIEAGQNEVEINNNSTSESRYYYGKNRFKWSAEQPQRFSRTPLHNIIRLPTSVGSQNIQDESENLMCRYWSQFFDDSIENIIIEHTNKKLYIKFESTNKLEAKPLDKTELRAFLGLLLYSSVFKSNRESIDLIFATDGTGRDIFRATMSRLRFLTILSCLRFDNTSDRKERLLSDPLAAVSEMFNKIIENCKKNYSIGTHACIDEMLVPFRGRCKFKVYMPQKPAKYGIKIMALTDARTHYLANAYIYYGKNSDGINLTSDEKKLAVPTQSVLRLCSIIEGSNRNITADNWFSSIQLAEKLKDRQLTYLGTLRKNKKEIPLEFLPNRKRLVESSIYGFTKDITLLSYVPKKNRSVILISTMHHQKANDPLTNKPEMIADYNNTKGGVDELDKKCSIYSCSRRTRRWPLAVFYRIIDISAVNAYILNQSSRNYSKISRADFLKTLARNLIVPHLQRREHNQRLTRSLRDIIHMILGSESLPQPVVQKPITTSKLCYICPNKLKRKTTHTCLQCEKPMCMGCSKRLCINCTNTDFDE